MKVWRINTRTRKLEISEFPASWERLGGRGLIARILNDELNPNCAPLGPENKLIFAPGLLVGHRLSSCDRISIGGKSPLTGGVKEANAGGSTGLHLTHIGCSALILEDQPIDSNLTVIYLSTQDCRFDDASNLAGKGVYESSDILLQQYGPEVAIALIGPSGEMQLKGAGIQNLDQDLVPSRIAARGGLGAVMGSKGIKALVIDSRDGSPPDIADLEGFRKAQKSYNKALMDHPQTKVYADYGTAAMARICHSLGGLPTRNFTEGNFESLEDISAETMRDQLLERGGDSNTTHACMVGCVIRCSNVYADGNGKEVVSPLEYETIGLLGSNLGIGNLEKVAKLNWEANDLGLDSIELGAALAVAAEAGKMEFGNFKQALELIGEIRAGTPTGLVIGNGAVSTGLAYQIERVPVVKGQAMSAYDPRAIKGTGVTYATSPQGADHTSGLTIRAKIDHLDPHIQIDVSRKAQINAAGYDTLGVCAFAGFGFGSAPETISALLQARYGWDVPGDVLQELGRQTLILERKFNRRAGFSKDDDRLPVWMTREELSPHNAVFDIPNADLDKVFDWIDEDDR
ncbi:MAG TPA: aldehyde ferredoxin oxidoreductase [Chloroflexi bacterium]|nr:aldehyde ferredoxin oxidoreductase [Chloroflexota bacterium]